MTKNINFEVVEDNAGGLYLFIFDNCNPVLAFSGFEYNPGSLRRAIQDIENGEGPESWDNAQDSPEDLYNDLLKYPENDIIADERRYYYDKMGAAGCKEFCPMPEVGTIYNDPDGEFEVTKVAGDTATIKNIQVGDNYGREYCVPVAEIQYFLQHPNVF